MIFLITGTGIGGLLVWFYLKSKLTVEQTKLASELKQSNEKSEVLLLQLSDANKQLQQKQEEVFELNKSVSEMQANVKYLETSLNESKTLYVKVENELQQKDSLNLELTNKLTNKEADLNYLQEKLNKQKEEISNLQEKFSAGFENLAQKIFEEKSQKFTEQNRLNIDRLLNPLNERIIEFQKRVEETYDKESKQRFSLEKEIKDLVDLNQLLSKEANNLTNALKGQAKTQGNWGEMILENILEKSGLVKDREYFIQQSFTNKQNKRLQPDVVVNYPGNRHVIIDSKVSLNAYERYCSSEEKDKREIALADHLKSMKNHINDLSSKNYQEIYDLQSLDHVFMFIPIEPAFMLALQTDSELWNYAYTRRILVISPTNLIAALKMIADLWKIECQNKNAMEIAKRGGDLYDKFVGFVEDLENVGRKIDDAKSAFNLSMNKLSEGRGNLIRRAEAIKELGARTKKSMPQSVLDKYPDDE